MLIVIPRATTKKINQNKISKNTKNGTLEKYLFQAKKAEVQASRDEKDTTYRKHQMVDLIPTLPIITLNISRLSTQMKRQRLAKWIF